MQKITLFRNTNKIKSTGMASIPMSASFSVYKVGTLVTQCKNGQKIKKAYEHATHNETWRIAKSKLKQNWIYCDTLEEVNKNST